ncbi:hypothetical protein BDW22DRAFT_1350354 [Trametopsis cervina]|nr:hypothetical protein BDW22DRAFT_1350354 [Trametopsis cervina]
MRFAVFTTVLAAVATAYADCSALGPGSNSSVSGTFNLAAFNPVTNTTSALHVLNVVTIPRTTYHVLGTPSSPSFGWLGLTMSGGTITTISPSPYTAAAYSLGNLAPNTGYPPNPPGPWPTFANTGTATTAFCSVPNPLGGNAVLAFNGFTDQFSLCTSYLSQTVPSIQALLFNASRSAYGDGYDTYNGASCVNVTVLIVPA